METLLPHLYLLCFYFHDTATTEIYTTTDTLSLHDALPISWVPIVLGMFAFLPPRRAVIAARSEEHTSELQSPVVTSYAVFCLKKKNDTEHLQRRGGLRQQTEHDRRADGG